MGAQNESFAIVFDEVGGQPVADPNVQTGVNQADDNEEIDVGVNQHAELVNFLDDGALEVGANEEHMLEVAANVEPVVGANVQVGINEQMTTGWEKINWAS